MIRVAIVDDHHAIRVGLQAAIGSEPGLALVGAAAGPQELEPLLYRTRPDVVLLDYRLQDADGLSLCRRIKSAAPAPAVIIYSAYADASMTVPAIVAGADGLVSKGAPAGKLLDAIRRAVREGDALPPISPALLEAAGLALDPGDLPILGMLVDRTPPAQIASTLRLERSELDRRIMRMLGKLTLPVREKAPPS